MCLYLSITDDSLSLKHALSRIASFQGLMRCDLLCIMSATVCPIMSLLLQYRNPMTNTPVFSPFCSAISLPLTNLVGTSLLTFISGLWSFFFPHAIPRHFTGQLGFSASAHDYIPVLCPTSSPPVMWVAVERQPQSQRSE